MLENFIKFGRSGCQLSLVKGESCIQKISSSPQYNERLRAQYKKQKAFEGYGSFTRPEVYEFSLLDNLCFFNMEYIHGKTFDKFCIESGTNSIIAFTEELGNLIRHNLKYSTTTSINVDKLAVKLTQLEDVLEDFAKPYASHLKKTIPATLAIGPCHGDLTMSNIIFSERYYLIDFLDNIFDTPLVDLVKIKQDTQHNFFLNFISSNHTKIKVCLDYMDNRLNQLFAEVIQTEEFNWLSVYNLIRILPYLKHRKEKESIINSLTKYEYFIASSR